MVAVNLANKHWDKKSAKEQLDILSEAIEIAADEKIIDGTVIWCRGYYCCGASNILWLNDGVKSPLPGIAISVKQPYRN